MPNKIRQVTIRTKMLQEIAKLTTHHLMARQAEEYFSFHFKEELAVCLFQNRKLQFKLNLNKQLKQLMWFQELELRDLEELELQ
jgi:hypothetical protein